MCVACSLTWCLRLFSLQRADPAPTRLQPQTPTATNAPPTAPRRRNRPSSALARKASTAPRRTRAPWPARVSHASARSCLGLDFDILLFKPGCLCIYVMRIQRKQPPSLRGTPLTLMLTPLTASAIRQERTNGLRLICFPFPLGKSASLVRRGWRESEGLRWKGRGQTEKGKRNANMLKFLTRLRLITHINQVAGGICDGQRRFP